MNEERIKELKSELEKACGSLNAHGQLYKTLKETDDFNLAIEKIKDYPGVNVDKLEEVKRKYQA